MTALTAMQNAAVRLVGQKPSVFFSSQSAFEQEIANLLNEVARDIALSHDWRALTKIQTVTGDGTTTDFSLPDDYDRMVVGQGVHDGNTWFWDYTACPDLDTWITLQSGSFMALTPGWWIILDQKFQFYPAPPSGQAAKYPYISKNYARSEAGAAQDAFLKDDDTFVIDERLLTLGLIWRWREMKRLDSGGEQASFEKAFGEAAARDKGAQVIRSRAQRRMPNVSYGWPWPLGD